MDVAGGQLICSMHMHDARIGGLNLAVTTEFLVEGSSFCAV